MANESEKVYFPPYFAKRKHKMNPELIKQLKETVESEPIASDECGEYRVGKFLHRNCLVIVQCIDGVWGLTIKSYGAPVSLLIISEVKRKFVPDNVVMAHLYGSDKHYRHDNSIVQLYQLPIEEVEEDQEGIGEEAIKKEDE